MALEIGAPAGEAVFLVRIEHDSHRAARPQVELLHQPQRFPRHDAAAAVVGRAGADVPRIEVTAHDDDLIRPFPAADLADDVGGIGIGQELGLHLQADANLRAAVLHPLQALGVLDRDGGAGNLRHAFGVAQSAGVRRAQARRTDGADERRDGAKFRRPRRSASFDTARFRRSYVNGNVEENDLAAHASSRRHRARRTSARPAPRLRRLQPACRRCCRGRA